MKAIKEWDILQVFCLPHWFILHFLPLWDDSPEYTDKVSPFLIFRKKRREAILSEASRFKDQLWFLQLASSLKLLPQPATSPETHALAKDSKPWGLWATVPPHTCPAYVCHRSPFVPRGWRVSWFSKHGEISIPITLPPNNPFSSDKFCLLPAFHPQIPSTGNCGLDPRYSERAADDLNARKCLLWEELACYLPHTFLHPPQTSKTLLWSIFKEAHCVLMKYFSGFKCYFL